jgi:hypothetical protein
MTLHVHHLSEPIVRIKITISTPNETIHLFADRGISAAHMPTAEVCILLLATRDGGSRQTVGWH